MIYLNFLYFIIAIALFSAAPTIPAGVFSMGQNILAVLLALWGFWHYNRMKFTQLRSRLNSDDISLKTAGNEFQKRTNAHMILAVVLFAFEIFTFDLKVLLLKISIPGLYEFSSNILGLTLFLLHLSIIWYWGYRAMGDVVPAGKSVDDHIVGNIKFNLVLVIPWVFFSFLYDAMILFSPGLETVINTPLFRELFLMAFLVVFSTLAPVLITRLWDCEPLPPSELKDEITAFCKQQGVKFKSIMSWNALNKGLVTAAVMGVTYPFRYLLLTPQLMDMLDKDEIMAVVSHEVGHVKKKHIQLYLLFFMGFIFFSGIIQEKLFDFFFTTSLGLSIITSGEGTINSEVIGIISITIFMSLFIVYVRFIFGYFMRNFERQADGFCFESGIHPDHMVSSFMKLGVRLDDDGKKSNWHHFNLSQRIDFLRRGMENPDVISHHNKRVKRGLAIYAAVLILFTAIFFKTYEPQPLGALNLKRMAAVIENQLEKQPENGRLYSLLGTIYYELKEWKGSYKAFKYAIGLDYHQPEALNNFAWLLLTSEDESLKNPEQALKYAVDAARMQKAPHIMDTLAEAFYQNGMYDEAYQAAQRALETASNNRAYYKDQLEKMRKAAEDPPLFKKKERKDTALDKEERTI